MDVTGKKVNIWNCLMLLWLTFFLLCQNNMAEKILGLYLLESKKNFNNKNRNGLREIVKYIPDKGE